MAIRVAPDGWSSDIDITGFFVYVDHSCHRDNCSTGEWLVKGGRINIDMVNVDIQRLYERVLIREMDERVIEYVRDNVDGLPLDELFNGRYRIVIPYEMDPVVGKLVDTLTQVKGFVGFDKDNNALIETKLDPKYGRGDHKRQTVSVGKILNKLDIPDPTKKEYLNWFAKYKDEIRFNDYLDGGYADTYAVIISRAPVDLVRMSDHNNITSCHKQGGDYFKCAVHEAIAGGLIAYLVYRKDLEDKDLEDIENDDEIFTDGDRGIYGIRPVARLRVRVIDIPGLKDSKSKDIDQLAIPMDDVYGTEVSGFFPIVRKFFRRYYEDLTGENILARLGDKRSVDLRGGTYEDTSIIDGLWDFFDIQDSKFNASGMYRLNTYKDDGRESDIEMDIESYRFREVYDYANQELPEIDFEIDESVGEGLAICTASLDFDPDDLSPDIDYHVTGYDYKNSGVEIPTPSRAEVEGITINRGTITVWFQPRHGNSSLTPDEAIRYIDDLAEIETDIESFKDTVVTILRQCGAIPDDNFSRFLEWKDLTESPWENFASSENNNGGMSLDGEIPIGPFIIPQERRGFFGVGFKDYGWGTHQAWEHSVRDNVFEFIEKNFTPTKTDSGEQLTFGKFFESYEKKSNTASMCYVKPVRFIYNSPYDDMTVNQIDITIQTTGLTNDYFELCDFVDRAAPHIFGVVLLTTATVMRELWIELGYENFVNQIFKKYNYLSSYVAPPV